MKKIFGFFLICLMLTSCATLGQAAAQSGASSGNNAPPPVVTPVTANNNPSPTPSPSPKAGLPNFDHIVLIMLENRDYNSVIGAATQMPLLNTLATDNVLLSNYFAVKHPSLPNYIALMSGSTQNITTDCTDCFVNAPNLADEIKASGRTWKAYLDGMPSPCFVGNSGTYAQKHNPLLYFDSIRLNAALCDSSILPLTSLDGDLANNQLPNFSFIMPDLCNSGHDCAASVADKWVNDMVAKLQASPALGKNSLIIVGFDEGNSKDPSGCCGLPSPAGGHTAVVLISPTALPDMSDNTPYDHYSLLKTILTAWNLPALGATSSASTQAITAPWTGLASQPNSGNNAGAQASTNAGGNVGLSSVRPDGCSVSSPASGGYMATICFASPSKNSILSGNVTVTANITVTGNDPGVRRMIFEINNQYLLTDYSSPFTFSMPTEKWADGKYTLSVSALMRDGFTTAAASTAVSLQNGNAKAPVNTGTFTPATGTTPANGSPFQVVATGDGASGEKSATGVVSLIKSLNPNLFLYLGDVYESGSVAEFYNWYGSGASNFAGLRAITDPTIGNHEYNDGSNGAAYFDYWNNIPNYYSFNAGGWHIISLNANSSKVDVTPTGAEYAWLQKDLTANTLPCTLAFYHEPLYTIGSELPATEMAAIWSLLAQNGVSIVLNGHDHDYQRWVPLDGNGQPSPNGITEFVVGSGGHGLQKVDKTDSRVAFSYATSPAAFGALLLQFGQDGATFSYHSENGSVLDSGFISCKSAH